MQALRPYHKRNMRIKSLGLADSYREYLKSELWSRIRTAVLNLRKHTCEICSGRATQVHHTNYTKKNLLGTAVLDGKDPKALIAVCNKCHRFIEFEQDGTKCHPMRVRKRVFMLRAILKKR